MRETKFGLPQTFCAKDWTLSWAQLLSFDFGGFDDLCEVNCRIDAIGCNCDRNWCKNFVFFEILCNFVCLHKTINRGINIVE